MNKNNTPASIRLTNTRTTLTKLRSEITDIMCDYPNFSDHIDHLDGYMTAGISCMYNDIEYVRKIEIQMDDREHGPSVPFRSRGVGMDMVPGCLICGKKEETVYMSNIAAFVDSKQDGDKILRWFNLNHDCAYLDYRNHEPSWIQVKVGACKKHRQALNDLDALTSVHDVIRECMIEQVWGEYTQRAQSVK